MSQNLRAKCLYRKQPDLKPFEDIYRQHYTMIYRLVLKFITDRHEAEDIVQDVFMKLYVEFCDQRAVEYPKTWLYRVATNTCINAVSRRREFCAIDSQAVHSLTNDENVTGQLEAGEQRKMIHQALSRLENQERIIIVLYSEGLSYKEIAEVSGMKFTSVGKTISRTLDKLKLLLKGNYDAMLNE